MGRGLGILAVSLGCGLVAVGCSGGGGGGGGGGGVSNVAISGTLIDLSTSLASRSTNVSGALTQGVVSNPTALDPSGTDSAVAVGAVANDGTVASVNVIRTNTTNADGSATFRVQVQEAVTNFEFVNATITLNRPSVSYRQSTLSFDALAADGTGRSFIIVKVVETGSISTTLNNTSTSTETLVDFTGLTPALIDGTQSGNFTATEEYLFEYALTNVGGTVSAELIDIHDWADSYIFQRVGGPVTNQLSVNVTSLLVAGGALNGNDTNLAIAVGTDSGLTGVADGAALASAFVVSGGVTSATLESDVKGDVTPEINDSAATTVNYTGALTVLGTPPVSDGGYDTDKKIEFSSKSKENPTSGGDLQTAIDGLLGDFGDLEDLLYLPNETSVGRSYRLIH